MKNTIFYETILDNLPDGIYILDHKGNYIFVNSAYVQMLNMPKATLLQYNVHDFLSTGQIDFCISDLVYEQKRQIVMFQDVLDTQNYGRKAFRQMVISTPIFDEYGAISNILAIVRPLDMLNTLYNQANQTSIVSEFSGIEPYKPVVGNAIVAHSNAMTSIISMATTLAPFDSAVLITGESGTGKEVIAHLIHDASPRKEQPLIIINCASLPENLLEAELFGYEKGAFTGAGPNGKAGLFEVADGGTLFLDEINSMPIGLQGKVLRALETKTIQRLGSTKFKKINFRIVTATNEDLLKLVEEKRFRSDLYYRLSVIPIHLPPLRDRKEDIIPLAQFFLDSLCKQYDKQKVFTEQTLRLISNYSWPGNVRELKNFVERSVVMSLGYQIEILDIASFLDPMQINKPTLSEESLSAILYPTDSDSTELSPTLPENNNTPETSLYEDMLQSGISLDEYLQECERQYVSYALDKYGNSYKAADALRTSQSTIMRRKKKYSL